MSIMSVSNFLLLILIKCSICLLTLPLIHSFNNWTTWKNARGQTANIRKHLLDEHGLVWKELVVTNRLKGWEHIQKDATDKQGNAAAASERFSIEGFHRRLVRWIAVTDQASHEFMSLD